MSPEKRPCQNSNEVEFIDRNKSRSQRMRTGSGSSKFGKQSPNLLDLYVPVKFFDCFFTNLML